MTFLVPAPEPRSFRRDPDARPLRKRKTPLQEAFDAELGCLEAQLRRFGDIEAVIRLRALSEMEASLSTDTLCRLAAGA